MMEFFKSIINTRPKEPISADIRDVITRKKLQYCRFADTNQWQNMTKVALPEATFKFYNEDGTFIGDGGLEYNFPSTAQFIKSFEGKNVQCVHLIGPGELLEQTNPDEVNVIWTVIYHAGMKEPNIQHTTGGGYYHETWRRTGKDWFIQDLRFERTYFQIVG
ncbi:uncharacterized protein GGS22DRAFT_175385 [Annulohypoxylon maeteangense]|uniref:uncharacterized protein n=1 Tax=Annulohypoxylon maeteangense TaxID=1927788 RepID=UPI0020081AD8|nr:uncharacterized protein GGS22DRAFT_175385 [Annulohypoxylon maeteangense]KAI0880338.1 hypothetical protein GGS22DRAFT_175385 [Annulohypoxylon maeteangense]